MNKKRVLLLKQWFDPEPTSKGLIFARELKNQGFDVEVLTGFPNYPGGKIYPGYKMKLLQREVVDGIQVTRVPLYPNHDRSAIKRILNYCSFAVSAPIYGVFCGKRPDVIYAYHPPLTVGVAANVLSMMRRVPVVYDIQDMWPDTLSATGMLNNKKILSVVSKVCTWVYAGVSHIVVLSPGFKKLLIKRGVPESKIDVIYNWADESAIAAPNGSVPPDFPGKDRFRILFAGNMGKAQALETVLQAADLLQKKNSNISFVMLGGGVEVESLKARANEMGLNNVTFLPPVPMTQVGAYLAEADALLVHLRDDPLFGITIPSKTQAYMAAGKPLLMAVNGDAADLVSRSKGGVVAESENPASLARSAEIMAAMDTLSLQQMGESAKRFYQDHLSLRIGVKKFCQVFNRVAAKG